MLGIDLHKLKGLKFTHLIGNKLYGYYDRNGRDCGIVWDMAHALPRDTQLETYREQGLNVRGQYHSWTTCEQSIIRAIVLGRLTKTQLVQGLHARGYRDFKIIDDYVGGFVVIRDDREIGWADFLYSERESVTQFQIKDVTEDDMNEIIGSMEDLM